MFFFCKNNEKSKDFEDIDLDGQQEIKMEMNWKMLWISISVLRRWDSVNGFQEFLYPDMVKFSDRINQNNV